VRNDAFVRRVAVLLVLSALGLSACGGETDPATTQAGAAQVRLIADLYNGRFARAYEDLLPAHKQVVSRDLFVACARRAIAVRSLSSVEVLEVFDETVDVPRLGKRKTKAVRLRLTSTGGLVTSIVNHELKQDDHWYWILNGKSVRAYGAGRCPA
jgi:hypothetical protein